MGIENGKLTLVCTSVQRIKEHGVETNVVTLSHADKTYDILRFEEFNEQSEFVVGREYEVAVSTANGAVH